jgi:class 3 adenylate cyclase/tetratricopeptide (TPR) repeat protein
MALSATAKFCHACAHPAGAEVGTPSRSPEGYTPKHLAEKILTSKTALEGERKQVTVLFADLKGSMELLAARDPEEARKILDPVLELMMEAVHRYEGTVNQVMGDGIMALFGAPIAHEDHAVRACYAALRMYESVKRYAEQAWRAHGVTVQIRVGLNSGEVVVRAIRNDLHMDYTAIGETTHLAARMEQVAPPGTVLIAPATLALVEGFVAVKSRGPVPVKGRSEPIEVYELSGIGPARTRLQAAVRRGLTRFVGRDAEIEMLRRSLKKAGAGHGHAVGLVGEAGVGKSRLVWEFARSLHTRGWQVLESGSTSYGRATPYLPMIELLKTYLGIQERDEQREIPERVARKLLTLDRTREPFLTPLLALLDVPGDDAAWSALDPPQRRQRILEAVTQLLLRESLVQPLLLLFEDLHWIDTESQALLDSLMESLPTARILLVVSYRPEYQHAWGSKTYYTQLRIDPFQSESAEELLIALLGEDKSLEPLKRVLIVRTEGHPFFLEETVQSLVETKVLVGNRGAYRMTKAPGAWQIPTTVQAILAARIDRLPPENKPLLQAASVMGKDVPFTLLEAIADVPEENLRRGLTHLQTAEFLYETSVFPDLEYTFKHTLTHEVAYASLLHDRRRVLHARIVDAIEALYPDRLAEQVERLAHHAFRGELWEKAVTYLRQAGEKARAHSAYREAVIWFDQARTAIQHLPESRELREQAIDLRFELRNALQPLGEFGPILERLYEAEAFAAALPDPSRLGRVAAYLADYFRVTGDQDHAIDWGKRALAIAGEIGDLGLQIVAATWLGQIHFSRAEYGQAIALLRHNLRLLVGELAGQRLGMPQPPAIHSRTCLAWCLSELGEFSEAIALGEEAVAMVGSADHPLSRAVAQAGLGWAYLRRGEADKAIAALEQGLQAVRAGNSPLWFPRLASALGYAFGLSGRLTEALTLTEAAVAQGAAMNLMGGHSLLLTYLGEACLLAGRHKDARQSAEQALAFARAHKEPGYEGWALRLLAEIAIDGPPGEAFENYDRARMLADELGMRPLVAHCHLGLGKLYQHTDKREQAREHLATATTMYREMGMTYWLEKVEMVKLE